MTTVEVVDREYDPATGLARIAVVFRDPAGLSAVRVYSDDGVELGPVEQPQHCPEEFPVVTPWVLAARFPLQAEATSCGAAGVARQKTTREQIGPLAPELENMPSGPGPGFVGGCPPTECPPAESAECGEALGALNRLWMDMRPVCEECDALADAVNEKEAIRDIAFAVWILASVVAAATAVIWLAALIAGAVATAALAVFLWANNETQRLRAEQNRCELRLDALRRRFTDAGVRVLQSCCCFTLHAPAC